MNHLVEVPMPLFITLCLLSTVGLGMAFIGGMDLVGISRRKPFDLDESVERIHDAKGAQPDTIALLRSAMRLVRLERMQAPQNVMRSEVAWTRELLDEVAHRVDAEAPGAELTERVVA